MLGRMTPPVTYPIVQVAKVPTYRYMLRARTAKKPGSWTFRPPAKWSKSFFRDLLLTLENGRRFLIE